MKKLLKVMIPVILVIACMFTLAVSASAAELDYEEIFGEYERVSSNIAERQARQDVFEILFGCIVVIAMILGFACVGYIAYAAPECGMSRWWAIAPIINNVLGLIVFIVVYTRKKNGRSRKTAVVITCPTCGGKHEEGAGFCSICGTKL